MAEIIVNLVLSKLANAVVQEALLLHGVHDKVKWVQDQLEWIQSFLKDADAKRPKDNRVKKWVNDVQEVGLLIDDVLEKFLAEVGGGRSEGLLNKLKKIGKMPMNLMAKHKLGNQIDQIQQRLRQISENTKTYGIIEGLNETSTGAFVEQPITPVVHPDIDEIGVIGFEVQRKTIVDQLIDADIMWRSVISIVGAGGSGKTTLAKKVYKSTEVKGHFGSSCIWVTISQDYKLINILMKILKDIGELNSEMEKEIENLNSEMLKKQYLITELNKCMIKRKYLVVLDDVWSSNNVWTQLEAALPNANNGSRVLITTRFIKIAEETDRRSNPHEIKALDEEQSIRLLLKKVFPNRFANECPNEVQDLAKQFAEKCGGWPLPLVVLGGILSRKNPNYITWDEMLQNLDWHTDGSNFIGVISTSYNDLPATLKPCFMYFGVFPEDYHIKATTLIQLWIAEGFIRQDGNKILEDIAESYLEELVQRCMVQVSRRSYVGKIKYCHIHDLLRDLAIQKAKEDNFLTVVSTNNTKLNCTSYARRVSLHSYGDKMIEHACKKNIRTLINFEDLPDFNRFGTLRVLHMSTMYPKYLKGMNALTALKYFGLEGGSHDPSLFCNLSNIRFYKRPPFTNMKNLQTVCTWFCNSHGELPPSFWGNKQLRHINFTCCFLCKATPEGPPSATDLQSLLALKWVRARQNWVAKLPNFPNLRKLGIVITDDVAGEPLINFLSNLNHLGSLHIKKRGEKSITFPDCISAFSNHNRLRSFYLGAMFQKSIWPRKEVVESTLFPPHLIKLKLRWCSFEEDPMPQLEKLPNLRVLDLDGKIEAADGKQMICSRGGFGRLERFEFYVDDLEEWKIEEGAMPMLNELYLETHNLQIVPDLQYLVNLHEFSVSLCSDLVKSRLRGEDQWKIKHIPSVVI